MPAGIHLGDPPFADVAQVAHQPLGAAADLARLFLEVAARAIEKARRGEMLFKRDGAHGLDAPLPPDITPKPGFLRKTPMLEANGGDFPGDPEALPNDWPGADLSTVRLRSPLSTVPAGIAVPTFPQRSPPWLLTKAARGGLGSAT